MLEDLNLEMAAHHLDISPILPEDPTQDVTLEHVKTDPLHINGAVLPADLPASTVSTTLAMLEMKGSARQVGPMTYVRH